MKKIIIGILILNSFPLWACWNLNGSFNVNGKKLAIQQKVNHDKSYSFQNGELIVHVKLPSKFNLPDQVKDKKDAQLIQVELIQKQGVTLKTLSKAEVIVLGENEAGMTKENPDTKEFTEIKLSLKHI
ncbi:MAG: hypothetical protein ACOVP4_09920 [Bacteriovoracaceae bacterium]